MYMYTIYKYGQTNIFLGYLNPNYTYLLSSTCRTGPTTQLLVEIIQALPSYQDCLAFALLDKTPNQSHPKRHESKIGTCVALDGKIEAMLELSGTISSCKTHRAWKGKHVPVSRCCFFLI